MAARKMTFTLPEDLAAQFVRRVPVRDRSRYIADALVDKLERGKKLIQACQIVNGDPAVLEIEKEFDAIQNDINKPWDTARR